MNGKNELKHFDLAKKRKINF